MFKHPIPLVGLGLVAILYFSLFAFSSRGYGYPGYHGWYAGPAIWYMGGPRYHYPGRSVREASVGGPGRAGGISGGK